MKNNLAYAGAANNVDRADSAEPQAQAMVAVAQNDFLHDLHQGLGAHHKRISPKYFYDAQGSALFDRICTLPEYYPTRTELALLQQHAPDMAAHMGAQAEVVEFGAGSLRKVRLLLDAMDAPRRYIPIDISGAHLNGAARGLRQDYPGLRVTPLVADYTQDFKLPPALPTAGKRVGFFPGSTLGNFEPQEALRFLQQCAKTLQGGALILGADLVKSPDVLHAAYNDAQGVTAAFNRNVMVRANRELGANFLVHDFAHSAFYNAPLQRIEMHLMSTRQQTVRVAGSTYSFAQGETLHTENSYKFTIEGLHQLALQAGLKPGPVWTDPQQQFCLLWLDVLPSRNSA